MPACAGASSKATRGAPNAGSAPKPITPLWRTFNHDEPAVHLDAAIRHVLEARDVIAALLNPRAWLALAFAAVLAFAGFQYLEADHAKTELAQAKEQWESERAAAAAAAQAAEAAARAEEARRTEATRKVIQDAQSQTQAAQVAAVAAAQSADSLRQRVAALVVASRAPGNPAAAGRSTGQQGSDALDVLAGVLARLDDAAGDVAAYADKLRIAGSACEAQADALRLVSPKP